MSSSDRSVRRAMQRKARKEAIRERRRLQKALHSILSLFHRLPLRGRWSIFLEITFKMRPDEEHLDTDVGKAMDTLCTSPLQTRLPIAWRILDQSIRVDQSPMNIIRDIRRWWNNRRIRKMLSEASRG